jgi:hypothetical protein
MRRPDAGWYGCHRHLREDRDRLIWIPRVRCRECGRTQVLLPWFVLPWRLDAMEWIWRGIELAAAGWGYCSIAALLGRPESPVRDGLRRVRWAADAVSATPGTSDELGLEWLGIAAAGTAPAVAGGTGAGRAMAAAARAGQRLVGNQPHYRREAAGDQQKHALGGEGELGLDGQEIQLGGT